MENPHERLSGALQDGDDFPAAAFGYAGLLLGHSHPYAVPVQGSARFAGFYIDIFILSLDVYEGKPFAGHLDDSLEFGDDAFFLVVLPIGTVLAFGHVTRFIEYKDTHILLNLPPKEDFVSTAGVDALMRGGVRVDVVFGHGVQRDGYGTADALGTHGGGFQIDAEFIGLHFQHAGGVADEK